MDPELTSINQQWQTDRRLRDCIAAYDLYVNVEHCKNGTMIDFTNVTNHAQSFFGDDQELADFMHKVIVPKLRLHCKEYSSTWQEFTLSPLVNRIANWDLGRIKLRRQRMLAFTMCIHPALVRDVKWSSILRL